MEKMLDQVLHRVLKRPYRLSKVVDCGGGRTVVLLHGIGRSGHVWEHVIEELDGRPYRVVAFDLLGFGSSPKPEWPDYTVDDHARAVIASIESLRADGPVSIVGHSMGCLVAVRVARLRPDLVSHMVLYEMPLYEGLPEKRQYRIRLDLYRRVYERIIAYQPTFSTEKVRLAERIAKRVVGFEIMRESWQPFVKSLQNTILNQTAAKDLPHLSMPIDVIYGSYDMLVIRGKPRQLFGEGKNSITAHTVRARHEISVKASRFIAERIEAAEFPEAVPPEKRIQKGLLRGRRVRATT